jgi:hypothetical protein
MSTDRKPWMKWYPADWRDPRLRMCSLAARGLWIDLLSYMHEAEPYGHLVVADVSPSPEQIAQLVGIAAPVVRKALVELEAAGVFSRTEEGVIYSRRMVRDKAKADADSDNGKRGGNPKLARPDNPAEEMGVNPPHKAQRLEARSQKPEEKEPPDGGSKNRGSRLPEGFEVPSDWTEAAAAARRQANLPEIAIDTEKIKFTNHFIAAPGQKGVKRDWRRAWINWCLNAKGLTNGSGGYRDRQEPELWNVSKPPAPRSPPPKVAPRT